MIFAGAGAIWAAIVLLAICMCKLAADKPNPVRTDICLVCKRLPVYADGLCEPCWEIEKNDDWGWDK
jgi:hypothetical protein